MMGSRILEVPARPSSDVLAKFAELPVANISDVMARLDAAGPRIRPLHSGGGLCGTAFTVKTRPGDNLLIHHALDTASPGDVIVVDGGHGCHHHHCHHHRYQHQDAVAVLVIAISATPLLVVLFTFWGGPV